MELTLNVKKQGIAAGSLGWLADVLDKETTEVYTTHGVRGNPMIVLDAIDKEEEERTATLAFVDSTTSFIETWGGRYQGFHGTREFLGVQLTEAAYEKVRELGQQAAEVLREWLDEGDDLEITLTATKK